MDKGRIRRQGGARKSTVSKDPRLREDLEGLVELLPFGDATCPAESYGGGRYLFDTIKGSDFLPARSGSGSRAILLDFNYAYNPSCAYSDRWVCPLAPSENRLRVPIRAGEKHFKTNLNH